MEELCHQKLTQKSWWESWPDRNLGIAGRSATETQACFNARLRLQALACVPAAVHSVVSHGSKAQKGGQHWVYHTVTVWVWAVGTELRPAGLVSAKHLSPF